MEHACHHCGAAVEDGVPFCPQCGAPQIRIPGVEGQPASAPATPPLPPGTPGEVQPPAEPVPLHAEMPRGVEWSQAFPAAAIAGIILAIAWVIPFLGFLFWMVAGGILAVALYRRRAPHAPLTPALGARVGAVGGVFGFAVFSGLFAMELLVARGGRFREMLQQVVQQAAQRNADPRAQQMMQQMMTPAGLAALITVVMVILLIGFLALSSLGGAIGAWLFRQRE